MAKSEKLKGLYYKLELDSTDHRVLLSNVKNGTASQDEIDELLDIIRLDENGGKILDEIKTFENSLLEDIDVHLKSLEKMEDEDNDIAHLDESEQKKRYADLKKRYKTVVMNIE